MNESIKMNERIEQLAEQCYETKIYSITSSGVSRGMSPSVVFNRARFAELIIEECALQAELYSRSYSDSDSVTVCKGVANAVRMMGKNG